jgi:hypothetical protein
MMDDGELIPTLRHRERLLTTLVLEDVKAIDAGPPLAMGFSMTRWPTRVIDG